MLFADDFKIYMVNDENKYEHVFSCWSELIKWFIPEGDYNKYKFHQTTKELFEHYGSSWKEERIAFETMFKITYKPIKGMFIDQFGRIIPTSWVMQDCIDYAISGYVKHEKKYRRYYTWFYYKHYFEFRKDPVPRTGLNWYSGCGTHNPRTKQEITKGLEYPEYVRGKRNKRQLPDSWYSGSWKGKDRSWKNFRKTQYKGI